MDRVGRPAHDDSDRGCQPALFRHRRHPIGASGLPVFDVGGGVRSFGAGTQARYQWNAQWASHAFVEYTKLTGDVANSPIVTQRGSPNQAMFGFGTTYSFDIPALW